jgi:hypothetical protein
MKRLLTFGYPGTYQQRRMNMQLLTGMALAVLESNFFEHLFPKDVFAFLMLVLLAIIAMILVNNVTRRRERDAMHRALLDKFSSAHDFAEFMQSPAGQKYVMSFTDAVANPRNTILNTVRTGIILIFLGAGFYSITRGNASVAMFGDSIGAILTCLGFGFLISALVSYWLAKKIPAETKE